MFNQDKNKPTQLLHCQYTITPLLIQHHFSRVYYFEATCVKKKSKDAKCACWDSQQRWNPASVLAVIRKRRISKAQLARAIRQACLSQITNRYRYQTSRVARKRNDNLATIQPIDKSDNYHSANSRLIITDREVSQRSLLMFHPWTRERSRRKWPAQFSDTDDQRSARYVSVAQRGTVFPRIFLPPSTIRRSWRRF